MSQSNETSLSRADRSDAPIEFSRTGVILTVVVLGLLYALLWWGNLNPGAQTHLMHYVAVPVYLAFVIVHLNTWRVLHKADQPFPRLMPWLISYLALAGLFHGLMLVPDGPPAFVGLLTPEMASLILLILIAGMWGLNAVTKTSR